MTNDTHSIAERDIRKVIASRAQALRAKKARDVVSYGTDDFVQFSLAPPLRSEAGTSEGLEAWFSTWKGPIGYEIHDLSITADASAAFCHSLNRMSGTKTDGQDVDLWFRQTLCFRKRGGAWKIVHEHDSVPFYMDGSLRAAVDLAP